MAQDKNIDTEKRMLDFKERSKLWSALEIHKQINLWIRRIEQFELLGNLARAKELYVEFQLMMELLAEKKAKHPKLTPATLPSVTQSQTQAKEIELLNHALNDFNREEILDLENVVFKFYSDDKIIEQIYELMTQKFERLPLDDIDKINLDAALKEGIGNAQRHGHKFDASKVIEFHYLQSADSLLLRVTDQGEGFNHKAMLEKKKSGNAVDEARARYKEGGYGGLGIMLMLQCVDKVEFNDKGNQLTLTKYCGTVIT